MTGTGDVLVEPLYMVSRRSALLSAAVALVLSSTTAAVAHHLPPTSAPEAPVAHGELRRGGVTVDATSQQPVTPKVTEGSFLDWVGTPSNLGGITIRSKGELIYTDHVFDAHGADDGADAERLATLDPLAEAVPETYRIDPVFQVDPLGELGAPDEFTDLLPPQLKAAEQYGNAGMVGAADLTELRIAADASKVSVLGRFSTMTSSNPGSALLLLVDTGGAPADVTVPFNSGLRSSTADLAYLFAQGGMLRAELHTGASSTSFLQEGIDADGWTNGIEASFPRSDLAGAGPIRFAAATGLVDSTTRQLVDLGPASSDVNVANVAFRNEPVRTWFDKRQALALHAGSIDEFFTTVDLDALAGGANDTWRPTAGYHEAIFTSTPNISRESGQDGILQHYGLYLPTSYDGVRGHPLQFWMHWRGGKAHSAATVSPRIFRDLGEDRNAIVVAPRGRGTSTWYLGAGHTDVLQVWDDVVARFKTNPNKVTMAGHSMGGWASYLFPLLYPDRFAAAMPVAPPVTQGAWTGLDFPTCDNYRYDDYSFCYVATNDSLPRVQHTRKLLENLRNVPIAIYQAAEDELVPTSGTTRQVERLTQLGYPHRYYLFHGYEHYSHPVHDEWTEGAHYLSLAKRKPNPPRVSYVRDMPFESTVELGPTLSADPATDAGKDWWGALSFDFDTAYWMSELTPIDTTAGQAHFEGRSLAIADDPATLVPEAGGPSAPGQAGPYTMTGLARVATPLDAPVLTNGFEVTTTGTAAVRLALARMAIATSRPISGVVTNDAPVELRLTGSFPKVPVVTVGGAPVSVTKDSLGVRFTVPAGTAAAVVVTPGV